ncbi:MAG: adenine phosphoribosyltransferase [Deltaproteobacteria bacterium]|nr:adenine phosphoribosyltransferase [Deltaproteobacteria bacterium]
MSDLVRSLIRDVPDFPKPGIVFKDITPVLSHPKALREVVDGMAERYRGRGVDKVVAIESRGFLFGAPLAYALGAGLTIVRKPGKLPWKCVREEYALEYGKDSLEMHVDAVAPGNKVLVIDDLLATGGTAEAVGRLVARQGATVAEYAFVVELSFLSGRKRLGESSVYSLIQY